jgi:hypothetical protein
MKFFDAIDEKNRLINTGEPDAIHLEVIDWNGRRNSVVFKNQVEADNFIKFNADWDVEINRIGV